jgi:chromosome segregation ATPase
MSMEAEEHKRRVLAEARETIKRVDAHRQGSQVQFEEPLQKWRREMDELTAAREAEKEKMSFVQDLYRGTQRMQRDISMGLSAVNQLAEKITDRLDDLSQEIDELRTKLKVSDARFEDLKKSVDARTTSGTEVVELPKPRRA